MSLFSLWRVLLSGTCKGQSRWRSLLRTTRLLITKLRRSDSVALKSVGRGCVNLRPTHARSVRLSVRAGIRQRAWPGGLDAAVFSKGENQGTHRDPALAPSTRARVVTLVIVTSVLVRERGKEPLALFGAVTSESRRAGGGPTNKLPRLATPRLSLIHISEPTRPY